MALDVASNYLASFQPVAPVQGFSTVLDNSATEALLKAQMENAAINLGMAQQGLIEYGGARRQKDLLAAQAQENELTRRANRRGAIGRMAGQVFGSGSSLPGLPMVNPMDQYVNMEQFLALQDQSRTRRSARSTGFSAAALQGLQQGGN